MGNAEPLPRENILPMIPFGPGLPIPPGAINPLQERGRPDPRRYEYQTAQNINITETRLVPSRLFVLLLTKLISCAVASKF